MKKTNNLISNIQKDRPETSNNSKLKPILVFYIGIGSMRHEDVSEFLNDARKKLTIDTDSYHQFFIPSMERDSRIELLNPNVNLVDINVVLEQLNSIENRLMKRLEEFNGK